MHGVPDSRALKTTQFSEVLAPFTINGNTMHLSAVWRRQTTSVRCPSHSEQQARIITSTLFDAELPWKCHDYMKQETQQPQDYITCGLWKERPESYRIYKIWTQNSNIWKQDQGCKPLICPTKEVNQILVGGSKKMKAMMQIEMECYTCNW